MAVDECHLTVFGTSRPSSDQADFIIHWGISNVFHMCSKRVNIGIFLSLSHTEFPV